MYDFGHVWGGVEKKGLILGVHWSIWFFEVKVSECKYKAQIPSKLCTLMNVLSIVWREKKLLCKEFSVMVQSYEVEIDVWVLMLWTKQ